MNIEKIKDIFFFVGSILGILAFFKTIFEPLMEANRRKWNEIKNKISENDLRELDYGISISRRIDSDMLMRFHGLVRDIEDDAEYVRFGWPLRRRYIDHLKRFVTAYHDLQEYISVPYWQWQSSDEDDEASCGTREFQKSYFFQSDYQGISYEEHLRKTGMVVDRLRSEHRLLGFLSNLSAIEVPFVRWILRSRVRPPLAETNSINEPEATDASGRSALT